MPSVLDSLEIVPLELQFRPAIKLTDDQLFEFCQQNRDWRIERSAKGEILIMSPAGGDSSARNLELTGQFYNWTKRNGSGVAFDASAGFTLPNGAMRSPILLGFADRDCGVFPSSRNRNFYLFVLISSLRPVHLPTG